MRTKEERPVRRVREQRKEDAEPEEDDLSPVRQTSKRGRKTLSSRDKEYDEHGVHIATRLDICDCLDAKCVGNKLLCKMTFQVSKM